MNSPARVIVDIQGKLAHLMHNKQTLFDSVQTMIKGARVLGIPILWLEQLPDKLGATIPEVAELLSDTKPIEKFTFSGCGNEQFLMALEAVNADQILMVGIEAHICVYQTAIDLKKLNYEVEIVTDAVSSRTNENKQLALQKMAAAGIGMTSTEMALFELLEVAQGDRFKSILGIVK